MRGRVSLALMPELPRVPALDPYDRRRGLAFAAYKWGLSALLGSVGLLVYQLIGRADLHRSTTLLDTALDRAIPLWPWSAWFYEPLYAAIFVIAVIGFRSRWVFHPALAC